MKSSRFSPALRVCLPVKELLSMLSQLVPPANTQASKMQRLAAKAPTGDAKRKDLDVPSKGQSPVRQSYLPRGSSSSAGNPRIIPGSRNCSHTGSLTQWRLRNGKANGPQATPRNGQKEKYDLRHPLKKAKAPAAHQQWTSHSQTAGRVC